MLFDLRSGKRRRMVQIVYSLLAASFLIGFVFFGVGTGGIGSISDVLGIGGGGSGSGSTSTQFDDQIDRANAKLAKNPKDEQALIQLAENQYYKGRAELGAGDPTAGTQFTLTDTAHTDLGIAVDTWAKYLAIAKKPDASAAQILVQAYVILNNASGAAKTQEIVVEAKPSAGAYNQLAYYLYIAAKIDAADAAAKKAVSLAPASQRKDLQKQFDQLHKQAVKFAKAQKKAAGGGGGAPNLASPFGGLGDTSGTATAP